MAGEREEILVKVTTAADLTAMREAVDTQKELNKEVSSAPAAPPTPPTNGADIQKSVDALRQKTAVEADAAQAMSTLTAAIVERNAALATTPSMDEESVAAYQVRSEAEYSAIQRTLEAAQRKQAVMQALGEDTARLTEQIARLDAALSGESALLIADRMEAKATAEAERELAIVMSDGAEAARKKRLAEETSQAAQSKRNLAAQAKVEALAMSELTDEVDRQVVSSSTLSAATEKYIASLEKGTHGVRQMAGVSRELRSALIPLNGMLPGLASEISNAALYGGNFTAVFVGQIAAIMAGASVIKSYVENLKEMSAFLESLPQSAEGFGKAIQKTKEVMAESRIEAALFREELHRLALEQQTPSQVAKADSDREKSRLDASNKVEADRQKLEIEKVKGEEKDPVKRLQEIKAIEDRFAAEKRAREDKAAQDEVDRIKTTYDKEYARNVELAGQLPGKEKRDAEAKRKLSDNEGTKTQLEKDKAEADSNAKSIRKNLLEKVGLDTTDIDEALEKGQWSFKTTMTHLKSTLEDASIKMQQLQKEEKKSKIAQSQINKLDKDHPALELEAKSAAIDLEHLRGEITKVDGVVKELGRTIHDAIEKIGLGKTVGHVDDLTEKQTRNYKVEEELKKLLWQEEEKLKHNKKNEPFDPAVISKIAEASAALTAIQKEIAKTDKAIHGKSEAKPTPTPVDPHAATPTPIHKPDLNARREKQLEQSIKRDEFNVEHSTGPTKEAWTRQLEAHKHELQQIKSHVEQTAAEMAKGTAMIGKGFEMIVSLVEANNRTLTTALSRLEALESKTAEQRAVIS